jgi:hypothetical protein
MALIRDNRGALLASNLSQYLAGAANTAGTPIDTNQLVSIVNQFLGQGEQISADITTISNGIYKKFGALDTVVNRTQIVTSGIWSGDTGSLYAFYTSSAQVNDNSGKYYINVYNLPTSSTSANVQFSVAYGDYNGFGAPTLGQDQSSLLSTTAVYYQMANVLLDPGVNVFQIYSGSTSVYGDMNNFYAININRANYKERLDPGNISLTLSGSRGLVTLIDDSGGTGETVTTAGRVYNLVSGSLNIGTSNSASINSALASNGQGFGLFYPDMGVLLLNPSALSASVGYELAAASSSVPGVYQNLTGSKALIDTMNRGGVTPLTNDGFVARRTENVSTSHYFVRANNREFNFSNNPSFVTGSVGQFTQTLFENDPHVYITTIGLYDDSNELIAVAKTSTPVEKSFDKEIAIRVKLDF